jgi:hypothetical protein
VIGHIREIVKQCQAAGVPVFVKQLGACPVVTRFHGHPLVPIDYPYMDGEEKDGARVKCGFKDKKGGNIEQFPRDLQVRESPAA